MERLHPLIDLKIDFAFKLLFGSAGNERILIELLNEILKLPVEQRIRQAKVLNPEVLKQYEADKKSVLDILVQTHDGAFINIEIQINNKYDMPVRTLYYSSRIFTDQMKEGMAYAELKQTIAINIVNFKQFGSTDVYHTRFELYDSRTKLTLTDRLQIHFVELPKLLKLWQNKEVNPREDRLVRWLLMLEAVEDDTIFDELEEIAMKEDPMLKEAFEKWAEMSSDPETKYAYEMRRKQVLDEYSMVREAEIRYEKGKAEGKAEGKAALLRTMLQNGLTNMQIAQMTGLTIGEVERIINHTSEV